MVEGPAAVVWREWSSVAGGGDEAGEEGASIVCTFSRGMALPSDSDPGEGESS